MTGIYFGARTGVYPIRFGQVWNLPVRVRIRLGLGGFRTRPYGGVSEWVWAGLEPARTGVYPIRFGRV